jgi:very-short-patch-repair endonuclease
MGAVLACGDRAALSHQSAAVLWGFLWPLQGPIHVTSVTRIRKSLGAEILLHRSTSLSTGANRTVRDWIPVTTPRRTIEDLEGAIEPDLFRRAKRQAEFLKYKLKLPTDRTRSDLEGDFLRFLAKHVFPRPGVNVKVGKYRVDFLWPEQMLAVETDFFDYHRGHQAFEDDHQRDMELRRLGYTVRRYTGAQLDNYPAEIVAELREVLGGGAEAR